MSAAAGVPLRATVRLQLGAGFTLRDAAARVPYYADLGVSHFYLSPIAAAVPGSTHGYDVVDPGRVSDVLGGEGALRELAARLRERGMGLVLDIVPNHAAAHWDNPWWRDLLRHGRRSRYARWFDVDWQAPGCGGRLWLPVLDRPLHEALADGVLLPAAADDGSPVLEHHDQRFPLSHVEGMVPREPGALQALLERQPYRLAWWATAPARINYRRFFDITSLAALRMEVAEAFHAVHALPLRLVAEGLVDALRIDHVDGLADPRGYLRRLRQALDRAGGRHVPVFVEKILAADEALPGDWACDGTTGYDFMDQAGALLHEPSGGDALRALWRRSGRDGDYGREARIARAETLAGALQSEFARTLRALQRATRTDPVARELGSALLARALSALLVELPVYRTYAHRDGVGGVDAERFDAAAARAAQGADPALRAGIDAIARCMREAHGLATREGILRRAFRQRLEQLSAPLQAKSVEDTAFYRHGVLLSRNEVGSDPAQLSLSPDGFHAACAARARDFPHALLITASHDHKRGEDARARLAVLSGRADWWAEQVDGFEARAAAWHDGAPSPGDRMMLWQMLVGAWPLQLAANDASGLRNFAARIAAWQEKALHEAKLRTSWTAPDHAYEGAARALLERILLGPDGDPLRAALCAAAGDIGAAGALNGLVQATLRLTVPGTPDLYQGTEGWDLSLVDPDNRRPVDYALRERWLREPGEWNALLRDWRDGRIKAQLIAALLRLRADHPALFAQGGYLALETDSGGESATGPRVLAFERRHGGAALVVAVPLHCAQALAGASEPWPPSATWGTATFTLPPGTWRHVLQPRDALREGRVRLADLFGAFPIAVLLCR